MLQKYKVLLCFTNMGNLHIRNISLPYSTAQVRDDDKPFRKATPLSYPVPETRGELGVSPEQRAGSCLPRL